MNTITFAGRSIPITPKILKRFFNKVDKAGPIPTHVSGLGHCWQWIGGVNQDGYGSVQLANRAVGCHRVSWQIHNGHIPDGLGCLHRCDNRRCVNPDHMWLGTQKDNMSDASNKKRMPWHPPKNGIYNRLKGDDHPRRKRPELVQRGEQNGNSKMKPDVVFNIKKMLHFGMSWQAIHEVTGATENIIMQIKHGRTWRHIVFNPES